MEETAAPPPRGLQRRTSSIVRESFNFGIPSNMDCKDHTEEAHGKESWRFKIVNFIHSHPIQWLLMGLLLLDVILLFIELFLLANFPHCTVIERDAISCCPHTSDAHAVNATTKHWRWLAADSHHDYCLDPYLAQPDIEAGCDEHKYSAVHKLEHALFGCTVVILTIFFVELNALMIALQPAVFFRQFFFLLDYTVITVSLVMEICFFVFSDDIYQSLVGLLVIVRVWRFVRIGHGIVELTHEAAHQEYEKLYSYTEDLESILARNNIELPSSRKLLLVHEESGILKQVNVHHREELRAKYQSTMEAVDEGVNEEEEEEEATSNDRIEDTTSEDVA